MNAVGRSLVISTARQSAPNRFALLTGLPVLADRGRSPVPPMSRLKGRLRVKLQPCGDLTIQTRIVEVEAKLKGAAIS